MKEPVARAKRPWLIGTCIAVIALTYFLLLAKSRYPEPGPNLVYDTEPFEQVDKVETRYAETGRIEPAVESPKALAAGPDGRLYVAGENAVQVLDAAGTEVDRIPVDGSPSCIALTPGGDLFLGMHDTVRACDAGDSAWSDWGEFDAEAHITCIAANEEDVFVADAANRVVLRFGRDGVLKNRIGEKDAGRDIPGLVVPSPYLDAALDARGALWVVNPGRLGLESYRANGDLITSWYRPSLKLDGFTGCCNPAHIAFLGDGKLVTCEKGLVRVKVYEPTSGEFQELVAGNDLFAGEFVVRDIAVDDRGRILVLDSGYNAVRVFEAKETNDDSANNPA